MRLVIALLFVSALPLAALADEAQLDGSLNGGEPPQSNIVINTWPYPNCDPMGIDYDESSGLIWVVDQGGTSSQGSCPPNGQVRTFDPATSTWTLEFVISEAFGAGFDSLAGNGIEVVGDYVYFTDFNGDVVNRDDSIYKFTKTGDLVQAYDISYALDQCVGLGYLQGIFYVTTTGGQVYGFVENEAAGTMDLAIQMPIQGLAQSGGGGLDWNPLCGIWMHVDFRNVPPVWYVLDPGFNLVEQYAAETTNPIGITYGPPFVGLAAMYIISRDDEMIYKTNDYPPCGTTPVEPSTWGTIKSYYR